MRVAIGQFGGPTAVINNSLLGALETLDDAGATVFGIVGGTTGLLQGRTMELSGLSPSLQWLALTPGSALRAGRRGDVTEADLLTAVRHLQAQRVDALLVIGGNGTMALGNRLAGVASERHYPLRVIGIPKTIDNDIVGVDHTPGYPSAVSFVRMALRDLQIDLEAMAGFEQVRVVEVMGRSAGWLAAVATTLGNEWSMDHGGVGDERGGERPIVLLPERPLVWDRLLSEIERRVNDGRPVLVVVGEGVSTAGGAPLAQMQTGTQSAQVMLGGIGGQVAAVVRDQLGCGARAENLGLLQRCFARSATELDRHEARWLGCEAALAALRGEGGHMVGMAPRSWESIQPYEPSLIQLPFGQVAGRERVLPLQQGELSPHFARWVAPLLDPSAVAPYPRLRGLS